MLPEAFSFPSIWRQRAPPPWSQGRVLMTSVSSRRSSHGPARTYNARMGSVGDDLHRQQRAQARALTPDERLALTACLAEADVDLYCSTQNATREEARRVFVRARQSGRRYSRVMQVRTA